MPQPGSTPILIYNSSTASQVPLAANLSQGELAINVTDKKLYSKDSGGNVILIASSGGDVTGPATSTNLAIPTFSGTTGKLLLNNSGVTITAGVITGTGFTGAHNGSLGATTPSTVVATTIGATGTIASTVAGQVLSGSGAGTSAQYLRFLNSTNSDLILGIESSAGGALFGGSTAYATVIGSNNSNTPLQFGTNGTIKATIDSSGNVGIGVTPSAWNTTYYNAIQLKNGWANLASDIYFGRADITSNAYGSGATAFKYINTGAAVKYTADGGAGIHSWYNAPSGTAGNAITFTQAMALDASGNLGIGVTPSAWSGYKVIQAGIASFAGGSSGVYLLSDNAYSDNAGSTWKYINSGYAPAQYYAYAGVHRWRTAPSGTAGNAITFTTAMSLDASGGLTTLNTIGVGNATPSTSGAGITFPATQSASTDANTLDDYEEGTWTPNQGSGLTVVGAFNSTGTYTKVGRLVTLAGRVQGTTSIAVSAIGLISSNLPFGALLTHDYYIGSSTNGTGTISSGSLAYSTSVYATAAITASGTIYFTVTYMV